MNSTTPRSRNFRLSSISPFIYFTAHIKGRSVPTMGLITSGIRLYYLQAYHSDIGIVESRGKHAYSARFGSLVYLGLGYQDEDFSLSRDVLVVREEHGIHSVGSNVLLRRRDDI